MPQAGRLVLKAFQTVGLYPVHLFISFDCLSILALFEQASGDLPLHPACFTLSLSKLLFKYLFSFLAVEPAH